MRCSAEGRVHSPVGVKIGEPTIDIYLESQRKLQLGVWEVERDETDHYC